MDCDHCGQPLKSESHRIDGKDGTRYFCSKDCIRNQKLCDALDRLAERLDGA